jgi:hypothetical protein
VQKSIPQDVARVAAGMFHQVFLMVFFGRIDSGQKPATNNAPAATAAILIEDI